jgi:hypothetical protein
MSYDAPGVVFLPHKCSFLSHETKLKPFRSSMVLIQEGKASVPYLISCISIYIEKYDLFNLFLKMKCFPQS